MSATVEIYHRVEHGAHVRAGQFAVVRIERTLRRDGTVAAVARSVVEWLPTRCAAGTMRTRLDASASLAAEADRLVAEMP